MADNDTQENVVEEEGSTRVDVLTFVEAAAGSSIIGDGSGVKGIMEKTGLTESTVNAKLAKLRKDEFFTEQKRDKDGKLVYRAAEGDGAETTDKSKAKKNSQDKLIKIMVTVNDEKGKPKVKRGAIPIPAMPRGSRVDVDAAKKIIADLRAKSSVKVEA